MSRTDEEHAEFEQLTLSNFNMWSPAALKTFTNYSIIMASISNNIRNHVSGTVFPVANFWLNSTGWSGKFHVAFEHFEDLENLILNILKGQSISCLVGSSDLEIE